MNKQQINKELISLYWFLVRQQDIVLLHWELDFLEDSVSWVSVYNDQNEQNVNK
jgi:hypothetical protein